jgi:hypothetical protein
MTSSYLWLKVAHILAVTIWFGSAVGLMAITSMLSPAMERARMAGIADACDLLGKRVIAPAGMLALVTGLITAGVGRIGMPFWVWWGLGAAILILAVGIIVLKSGFAKLSVLMGDPATPIAVALGQATKLRRVATVVLLVMLSGFVVMVLKP